ncbi:hypothetical protein KSAC_08770 [Komagataeibacter saccharivorans]|uniref:hypothetical protein n=1 Tax=Komagataeibacter saccharivorans TaxID=265959 RepID=UPI001048F75E|nr:hypothetical protein [Komagataeibacter saccharivorans]QBL93118.1 hypothetical protein KSAC_08770 [Komagataeibacter saccharivorans]
MKHHLAIASLSIEQDFGPDSQTHAYQVALTVAAIDEEIVEPHQPGHEPKTRFAGSSTVLIEAQLQTLPATTTEEWLDWARSYLTARFAAPAAETPSAGH